MADSARRYFIPIVDEESATTILFEMVWDKITHKITLHAEQGGADEAISSPKNDFKSALERTVAKLNGMLVENGDEAIRVKVPDLFYGPLELEYGSLPISYVFESVRSSLRDIDRFTTEQQTAMQEKEEELLQATLQQFRSALETALPRNNMRISLDHMTLNGEKRAFCDVVYTIPNEQLGMFTDKAGPLLSTLNRICDLRIAFQSDPSNITPGCTELKIKFISSSEQMSQHALMELTAQKILEANSLRNPSEPSAEAEALNALRRGQLPKTALKETDLRLSREAGKLWRGLDNPDNYRN